MTDKYKVGDQITLEVKESDKACEGCFFNLNLDGICGVEKTLLDLDCMAIDRLDNKDVIFVLKKKGE